jgi:hypothetical protein
MPNTRVYPQLTEEQLNAAVNNTFAATYVDEVDLQENINYFQWKLANVFKLPRRFIGLPNEAELRAERQNSADRYQRYIDTLMSVQPLQAPTGILYWLNPTLTIIEKPLSGGFAFKLKRLNFGLTYISL